MSIGPSLQARERTTTTPETTVSTESSSFALRYAKRSFEPYNTDPCPRMFADKWTASE